MDGSITVDAERKEVVSTIDVDAVNAQDIVVLCVLENEGIEETALLEVEAVNFVARS